MELFWGDASHHERLQEKLAGKPIDFIVCADLFYDAQLFPLLIDTLTFLSQVN